MIKSIIIEFESEKDTEHATKAIFSRGKWTFNGPAYSRYHALVNEIWKVVRNEMNELMKEK